MCISGIFSPVCRFIINNLDAFDVVLMLPFFLFFLNEP